MAGRARGAAARRARLRARTGGSAFAGGFGAAVALPGLGLAAAPAVAAGDGAVAGGGRRAELGYGDAAAPRGGAVAGGADLRGAAQLARPLAGCGRHPGGGGAAGRDGAAAARGSGSGLRDGPGLRAARGLRGRRHHPPRARTAGGGAAYGTVWVILLAYLVRFQALALRPVAAAAGRLDPALDDAARGMGAGVWRRLCSVHLPPLRPALVAGGLLVALLGVNEVTLSSLLSGPGTQTLGMLVFNLQDGGATGQAAAVSLVALVLVAALMALAGLAGRRLPPGTLPWRP
ncbi:ABC transporter permease subunit [Roseomonas sp. CCTCC AB2023176]|uniref:ABC transporter permease subunit n=1 Tax=Roseomonas sp. CCTCC AB2023176 TaxID=3342640 RepID=UPI0035DC0780